VGDVRRPFSLRARRKPAPESIYFYTFHKCASTLFSAHVLGHVSGLRHRDYAQMIFTGVLRDPVDFEERGFVYGPIRLSARPGGAVEKLLVAQAATRDFVRAKICVFLVRDPRDLLVSAYYSGGFTHPLSAVDAIRLRQEERQRAIRATALDDHVLAEVERRRREFALLHDLHTTCSRSVLLRYEDMVNDFDRFAEGLCRYFPLSRHVLRKIERLSRPMPQVDVSKHRGSGRPGQFREALRQETVRSLNQQLSDTLELFGYEV
jgi:hypothetical protein